MLLVAVLLLIASGCNGFKVGQLYKYELSGNVDARISSIERAQHSGLALKSSVLVYQSARNELVVKVSRIDSDMSFLLGLP